MIEVGIKRMGLGVDLEMILGLHSFYPRKL